MLSSQKPSLLAAVLAPSFSEPMLTSKSSSVTRDYPRFAPKIPTPHTSSPRSLPPLSPSLRSPPTPMLDIEDLTLARAPSDKLSPRHRQLPSMSPELYTPPYLASSYPSPMFSPMPPNLSSHHSLRLTPLGTLSSPRKALRHDTTDAFSYTGRSSICSLSSDTQNPEDLQENFYQQLRNELSFQDHLRELDIYDWFAENCLKKIEIKESVKSHFFRRSPELSPMSREQNVFMGFLESQNFLDYLNAGKILAPNDHLQIQKQLNKLLHENLLIQQTAHPYLFTKNLLPKQTLKRQKLCLKLNQAMLKLCHNALMELKQSKKENLPLKPFTRQTFQPLPANTSRYEFSSLNREEHLVQLLHSLFSYLKRGHFLNDPAPLTEPAIPPDIPNTSRVTPRLKFKKAVRQLIYTQRLCLNAKELAQHKQIEHILSKLTSEFPALFTTQVYDFTEVQTTLKDHGPKLLRYLQLQEETINPLELYILKYRIDVFTSSSYDAHGLLGTLDKDFDQFLQDLRKIFKAKAGELSPNDMSACQLCLKEKYLL